MVWTVVGDKTTRGKQAIREWMASMNIEPPKFTVDNTIADGDFVTSYGDMTMKDKDGKTVPSYIFSSAIQALALPFTWLARREKASSDEIQSANSRKGETKLAAVASTK